MSLCARLIAINLLLVNPEKLGVLQLLQILTARHSTTQGGNEQGHALPLNPRQPDGRGILRKRRFGADRQQKIPTRTSYHIL